MWTTFCYWRQIQRVVESHTNYFRTSYWTKMLILSSVKPLWAVVFKFCLGGIQFSKCISEQCTVPMFSHYYYLSEEFYVAHVCFLRIPHIGQDFICVWQYSSIHTNRQGCSKFHKSFFLLYTLLLVLWNGCLRASSDYHVNTEAKYL